MISGIESNMQGWLARISDGGFGRLDNGKAVLLDMVLRTVAAETSCKIRARSPF